MSVRNNDELADIRDRRVNRAWTGTNDRALESKKRGRKPVTWKD